MIYDGKDGLQFGIRRFKPQDLHLIFSSWIGSYSRFTPIRGGHYPKLYDERIKALIGGEHTRIRVAHSVQDEDRIFGWAICEGPVLHFVFVKKIWRAKGVGRALVAALELQAPVACTHWTKKEAPDGREFIYVGFP